MGFSFLKVLEKFNFGPNFIQIIKTCYNNIQSAVKVNGFASSFFFFYLSRGIRQGCPISTVLYILVAETARSCSGGFKN